MSSPNLTPLPREPRTRKTPDPSQHCTIPNVDPRSRLVAPSTPSPGPPPTVSITRTASAPTRIAAREQTVRISRSKLMRELRGRRRGDAHPSGRACEVTPAIVPLRAGGHPPPERRKRPIPVGTERLTTAWHHPVAVSGAPKGYVFDPTSITGRPPGAQAPARIPAIAVPGLGAGTAAPQRPAGIAPASGRGLLSPVR